MAIKQVKKINVGEQVFSQLKQQLLDNEWNQGEKIPSENVLAEAFGVSRVTVRQAIQKLVILGLLETRLGEGSFVKEAKAGLYMNTIIPIAYLGKNSFEEVLEFRRKIEGAVAELATEKITENDINELENCYKQMEFYKDDLEMFSKTDFEFHMIIAKASKNSLFIEIFNIMNDVLRNAMLKVVIKKGNSAGLYYHKLLLETIKERDPKHVRRVMDEHMEDNVSSFNMYGKEEE
ncbi:FadR/GntR family transcriptional regulator [Clostridium lacusfryxellense]|uniref:FadR/GntR family transcriptional regulator n=1 Tax=Clostridium lacusfryxellense TaxID=205328 RepID=UPI001C0D9C31|nr:FadR/GntR family transcriptional regulator [Clostridium lacusfryxellense]MBU3113187.1 FadR family transcriptional regulator [Clostridium lacusfryxellense]